MEDLGFRVTEDIQDDEGTVYAAWMRRKPTVHDTAMTGGDGPRHAPRRVRDPREAQHPRDLRQARRAAPLRPRSSAAPAATASPTPSTSTCATPTATASRSTRRTTTPATPTTRWSRGTCTTTSAATGGATRSCRPGTPRPRLVLDLDGNPQPVSRAPTPSEMAVTIGADGFSYTRATPEAPASSRASTSCGQRRGARRRDGHPRSPTSWPRPTAAGAPCPGSRRGTPG